MTLACIYCSKRTLSLDPELPEWFTCASCGKGFDTVEARSRAESWIAICDWIDSHPGLIARRAASAERDRVRAERAATRAKRTGGAS